MSRLGLHGIWLRINIWAGAGDEAAADIFSVKGGEGGE